jgi:hypothetical protein
MKGYCLHIHVFHQAHPIYFPKSFAPNIKVKTNKTRQIKNRTLAIEAAPAANPPNPKIAAMMAIIKKIAAHLSIVIRFSYKCCEKNTCQKELFTNNLKELFEADAAVKPLIL